MATTSLSLAIAANASMFPTRRQQCSFNSSSTIAMEQERSPSLCTNSNRVRQCRLRQRTAGEVRCLVDAAAAFITCDLRVGTKGPGTIGLPFRLMRSDDTVGRFSLFDPLFDDGHLVKSVGTFATRAVSHARHHKEPDPVGSTCGISALIDGLFVESDRRAGCVLLVCPAVIEQQLASALRERRKIWI